MPKRRRFTSESDSDELTAERARLRRKLERLETKRKSKGKQIRRRIIESDSDDSSGSYSLDRRQELHEVQVHRENEIPDNLCEETLSVVPKNIRFLQGPEINPEISESITDAQKNHDKYMSIVQNQLGNGLSALAKGLNALLVDKANADVGSKVMPCLIDAGKVITDAFHMITKSRKFHIEANLNPTVKKIVRDSKPDKFLCGENFSEKFKEAKNHQRTGKELKFAKANFVVNRQSSSTTYARSSGQSVRRSFRNQPTLNYRGAYHKNKVKRTPPPRTQRRYPVKAPYYQKGGYQK
ncbi:uncharacterized protein LOC115887751 isoform X3 [Sitophilus oryzae]|uniref:Uncharacterized protein LOC115881662 isoform X3 n=1 Tax=Sitophilus oryzae TaxID=7048 RepID=A0A6J2YIJ6_SITOR|nr:uncharacterized protein LOC115881662 isoform X3 [Sitophilus oryzae]XP_030755099.1 uncharacterized protein LOC115881662 isoform X3 [Sitophilus oryzae]XP_030763096.1 uncharacterized protein LOC115887751 isoform X3 [Sitophilus oryzae]XP_030763097.1 uncharacterized protein LOC115887751 isoform X3 [Sitophilus oryzae]